MIAFLQPFVPHYRENFFNGISQKFDSIVYCYQSKKNLRKNHFQESEIHSRFLNSIDIRGILIYNPLPFLKKDVKVLILMLHYGHITSWLLLLTKLIHGKKIILWGHGISVKRYIDEEKKPHPLMKLMIYFSDGIWFYTDKERKIWKEVFPQKKTIALNNTISEIDEIISSPQLDKNILRQKYGITTPRTLIFCARFNTEDRRIDLLLDVVSRIDKKKYSLIIIGDGKLKPDFQTYSNVYDFGGVYDRALKNELFCISDIYFQPAWVGLSIVEALAYGKPIFTFARSENVLQCVEYYYINSGENGEIFTTTENLIRKLDLITDSEIAKLSSNSKSFARSHFSMTRMVNNGLSLIEEII